ncbi:hypothetical protein CLOM_g6553 [Closterium sp. NIES-68]|nr:hypothetical protein CLOM_g6553 [Closterium sp. NIES-68]GJP75707.1 hypothetical protein CLOP_g6117 [Closterium sp. NIES-67]
MTSSPPSHPDSSLDAPSLDVTRLNLTRSSSGGTSGRGGGAGHASSFRSLKPLDLRSDESRSAAIPLGPEGAVFHGRLDNGVSYYVRRNGKPQNRAALALAIRVGSLVEQEEERGVAHILEHLAFSATRRYSNHDIVRFLESIGAEFGACQNAYTSADETVFELQLPVDKPELLPHAVSVLADFASDIRISSEDVEKERGAVMEEWRERRGAMGRMQDAHWQLLMKGSKAVIALLEEHFAPKLPLSPSSLPAVPEEPFQPHSDPRFSVFVEREAGGSAVMVSCKAAIHPMVTPADYRLYLVEELFQAALSHRLFLLSRRPDPPFYAAAATVEALVKSTRSFSLSASCQDKGTLKALEALWMEVARVQVHGISDRELAMARVQYLADIESAYVEREQTYSESLRDEYLQHFLRDEPSPGIEYEARLAKALLPGITAAEVAAVASNISPSNSCVVKIVEPRAQATVEAIRGVIDRVMQAKEATLLAAAAAAERMGEGEGEEAAGAVESGGEAGQEGEEVRDVEGEGAGAAAKEEGEASESKAELAEAVVGADAAAMPGTAAATAVATTAAVAAAAAAGGDGATVALIEPWTLDDIPESIVQTPPVPGEVQEQREYPGVGVTELRLSNGMRVAIKCTDFLDDQILISGYAYGGLSEVPYAQYHTAAMAQTIAGEVGIFGHPPAVMAELLAGKRVEVGGKLSSYMRVFSGECSPDDLETALQLVYQLFTCRITAEQKDVALIMQMTREAVRAQRRDPFTAFANRVREISYGSSYQFKPITEADLRRVDFKRACEYLERAFKDPTPFTVVIVGNTRLAAALPLIQQYLGGIPVPPPDDAMPRYERDSLTPLPFKFPDTLIREEVRRVMVEAQGSTQITFPLDIHAGPKVVEETMWVGFLTKLLETRIMQLLRFKHGQIYTVAASSFLGGARPSREGGVRGDLAVAFSCDPKSAWSLVDLSVAEMDRLQREGPSEEDVSTARELEQRAHEMGLQENGFWLDRVVRAYQTRLYDGNVDHSFQALEDIRLTLISQLSADSVRVMLTQLLPMPCSKQYTAVSLVPTQPLWRRLLSLPPKQHPGLTSESKALLAVLAAAAIGVVVWRCRPRH